MIPTTRSPRTLRRTLLAILATAGVLLATGCGEDPATAAIPDAPTLLHVNDAAPAAEPHGDDAATEAHAGDHPVALASDAPLPGESLYHLDADWTDHRGEPLALADLRGRPVIVVMIYASCETACPILVRDALRLEQALPAATREETGVLLVTFDTENDAPERLAAYVEENGLDDSRWRFAVGDASSTRALAAMLGVRYRPAGNGMFSHSNLITVLGPDGVPLARVEGLGVAPAPLVEAIADATR